MATVTRVAGNEEGNGKDARGREMMVAMGQGLCLSFFCVERPQKIRLDHKK
jgi:hypothetical protein